MTSISDRRLFKRVDGEFQVRCNKKGSRKKQFAFTRNISGGGVCLSVFKRIKKGLVLEFELLKRNSDQTFNCKGEIMWVARNQKEGCFDAGVQFMDMDLLYIAKLIKNLKGEQSLLSLGAAL